MTGTKRMPKPMTSKKLAQYRELRAELIVQAELIMSVFNPLREDREYVTEVKFEEGHPDGPMIGIWYQISHWDEDSYDCFSCPENYLGMTEDELKVEKTRLKEEEERKKAEMVARAKASREKRIKEKGKKEKDKRYKKYLELKREFESGKEDPKCFKDEKTSGSKLKCTGKFSKR